MKDKNLKKQNPLFTRMTLMMVLGIFVLLSITMLVTFGVSALIARYTNLAEDDMLVYAITVVSVSIIVGVSLSFGYSAIMVRASQPYIEALQRIAKCDFSVRIQDTPVLSGFAIADNFNDMAQRLASVETLREDFISNFSHEFKTPISSISGFATLLKNPHLSKEERDEYLDVIIDESNRLVQLSESVLMLSRLDSRTVVKESFLLDEQLRQSMLLFQRSCEQKKIELDADLDKISIVSEKKLTSQIWVNLLSNAVKFTPYAGKITVSAKQQGDKVCVKVTDDGCGMSQETMENIFIKFYQGDKSHATEGNGLGLAVVKKICDLLNITISVESQLGKGSTFSVFIDNPQPVAAVNKTSSSKTRSYTKKSKKK